jgi:outer membrane receptor for ferrienterochelin and colicin
MRFRFSLALCVLGFVSYPLKSQDLDSLLNLNAFTEESDLQKMLNKNVSVSSRHLTSRETPGIISVVTAEEIQNSGARDMIDVLRLVPGFDISQDLQFVMGLSLRGSWANEGKVLVLMDGQPFNDLLYQSVAVGNRFPVDAIERIEIIRGPGSARYGGSAEYGVINIITKAAGDLDGAIVYGTAGFLGDATGRTNAGMMAASKGEKVSWDVSAFTGKSIISDQMYQDIWQSSDPVSLINTTHADPLMLNAGFRYNGLSIRALYDKFQTSDPESNVSFQNLALDAQYKIKVSERVSLTPRMQYLNQIPWYYDYPETPGTDFEVRALRKLAQVEGDFSISRKASLNFGALYFADKSVEMATDETMLSMSNIALYAQALIRHRLANATIGFRFEKNNKYAAAFVPRIALTKKVENLHFKMLYSASFRSPSLQNVQLDTTGATPEKSNVFEFEVGYQFTPEMLLSLNAFHISTRDIIIYGSEGEGEDFNEWYESYEKSGSKGVELVYSIRKKKWYAHVTYSFSQAISDNTVDKYMVPQTNKQYVGMAAHKLTLNANINLSRKLSVSPTLMFSGERYAYTKVDENFDPVAEPLGTYTLLNLFINYKNLLPGLTIGGGAYDVFDAKPVIPQAYNGGSGAYLPIPGRGREYLIKLSYQINFKK